MTAPFAATTDPGQLMCRIAGIGDLFAIEGEFVTGKEIPNGHINTTYKATYRKSDGSEDSYILQRINDYVFKDPRAVMRNVEKVTRHINWKVLRRLKDSAGQTLNLYPARGGRNYIDIPGDGMVRSNTYHPKLNLLVSIGYEKEGNGETVVGHEYQYDALMRPIQRRDSWNVSTPTTVREFTYNSRSELINDQFQAGGNFNYQYDNIGNRKTSRKLEEEVSYESNRLNQYTDVIENEASFTPFYDADGNQTRIRTSTGIWEVSYDANDRPVIFTSQNGRTVSHAWYLYRVYLQLAELDLMHPEPELVKSYLWDPTEPTATRILMMTCWKYGATTEKEHLFCMHDALKNVTSIFDTQQTRKAHYEYAPFGNLLTTEGDMATKNKFRFSCEYADDELGLIYYNYRHLNPLDGRWISCDPIAEQGGRNLFGFIRNRMDNDYLGLNRIIVVSGGINPHFKGLNDESHPV